MNSRVSISKNEKPATRKLSDGDIVLIKLIDFNEEKLVKVAEINDNKFMLISLQDIISYTLTSEALYTQTNYITRANTEIFIIGICDINIEILNMY